MTFTKYTGNEAALTSVREQQNFARMLSKGVYAGFRVYPDSTSVNFAISIEGGFAAIKGVLIEDDQDNLEVLNLGAPVDATGDHHLIWLDNRGDVPVYAYKTGTYASLATLSASENENGIPIADVYIPNGSTNIQDAVIINRDRILSNEELSQRAGLKIHAVTDAFKVTNVGADVTLSFGGLQLVGINPTSNSRFPISQTTISTASASGDPGYDWELTQNSNGNEFVIFYVNNTNDFNDNASVRSVTKNSASDAELALLAGSATDTVSGKESYPEKPEFWDAYILAIIDTSTNFVITPFGTMRLGDELVNGEFVDYTKTITSTAYGTSVDADAASIDIDGVIDNLAKLQSATLDTAYDGFASGAAAGSGRNVTIDAGPITMSREGLSDVAPDDKWQAAMRIILDSDNTTNAVLRERGVDFQLEDIGRSVFAENFRKMATYREIAIGNGNWLTGTTNFTLSGGQIRTTAWGESGGGSANYTSILGDLGEFDFQKTVENWFVEFIGTGADCDDRIYRVRVDLTGEYFYLEDPEGNSVGISGQFPGTLTGLTTKVWKVIAEIGETSLFDKLEVRDDIWGERGSKLFTKNIGFQAGYIGPYSLIENGTGSSMAPIFPESTKVMARSSVATIGSSPFPSSMESDGKYFYVVRYNGVGANQTIEMYKTSDGSYVKALTTSPSSNDPDIAASGGYCWAAYFSGAVQYVQVFDVESGASIADFTIPGASINAIDSTGDQAFIACSHDGTNNIHRLSTTGIAASQEAFGVLDADDVSCFGGKIAFVMSDGRGMAGSVSNSAVIDSEYANSAWANFTFTDASRCFVGPNGVYFVGITTDPTVFIGKISNDRTNEREIVVRLQDTNLDSLVGFELIPDDQKIYVLGRFSGLSVDALGIYNEADFSLYAEADVNTATETYHFLTTDGMYLYVLEGVGDIIYRVYTGRSAGMWVEDYDNVYPRRAVPAGSFLT